MKRILAITLAMLLTIGSLQSIVLADEVSPDGLPSDITAEAAEEAAVASEAEALGFEAGEEADPAEETPDAAVPEETGAEAADDESADVEAADAESAAPEANSETADSTAADSETPAAEDTSAEDGESTAADSADEGAETEASEATDSEAADSETKDSEAAESETADTEAADPKAADAESAAPETSDSKADSKEKDPAEEDAEKADSELEIDEEAAEEAAAPGKVTNLKAVGAGKNRVKLTWKAVSGAAGYLVYAQKSGKYAYAGMTTSGTSFIDTKALDTDWNYYWVFAFVKNSKGDMIPGGCEKYVFAKGICPAVTGLKATSGSRFVKLTWSASAGAAGYLIYGKTSSGAYAYKGMTNGATTWTDTKAPSTEYSFYWVYPFHKNASGKMITGGTGSYVFGKAVRPNPLPASSNYTFQGMYYYRDDYSVRTFLILKNPLSYSVRYNVSLTAYDAAGNALKTTTTSASCVGPGQQIFLPASFGSLPELDYVTGSVTTNSSYYQNVLGSFTTTMSKNARNIVLGVKNNGSINADYAVAYALFFNANNEIVGYDYTYFIDADSELKVGDTIYKTLDCNCDYDHVKVYLDGYSDGAAKRASAGNVKVTGTYMTQDKYSCEFLITFKNNGTDTVAVFANGRAIRAAGSSIEADSDEFYVLGPGEEGALILDFYTNETVSKVVYTLSSSKRTNYDPVIKNLSLTKSFTANSKKVSVTVKNNGSYPAEYVRVYAVFLDQNGKVVDINYTYFTVTDYELKAGESCTKDITSSTAFSNVKLFFEGSYYNP